MLRTATALLITCLLCACGQRGNLYLPDAPADEVKPAATAPAAAVPDGVADERERERANAARNRSNR
jgi:predicted small lipoprotein YifL